MIAPITIGDQKFVKDTSRGWIDAKTKQMADKGLVNLLDSLAVEEPLAAKLRIKIDRSIEPIFIGKQKYVYDINQGWIDDKTKIRVPRSLQLALSNSVPVFTKGKAPDLSASLGIVGTAGLQQTKGQRQPRKPKTGGGTLVYTRTTLNKPLVAMINSLASIDGLLKQRLDNQKIISKNNILAIRESQIESIDQVPDTVAKPDAEKVGGSSAGLALLGGLALLTLDPVQEAIKDIANGVVDTGKFITGVVSSINKAFTFLLGAKTPADIGDAESAGAPAARQATPEKPSFLSDVGSGAVTGAMTGSVIPVVGTIVGGAVGGIVGGVKHFIGGSSTTGGSKSVRAVGTGGASTSASAPHATPAGGATTPQAAPISSKPTTASNTGEIPKNNIVELGKYLQGQGINVSEQSQFGGIGKHGKNSRHYRDMAIDLNVGGGGSKEAAIFDALEPQLRAAGYYTLWRTKGHKTHMHVSVGGPEGAGGRALGDSNTLLSAGAETVNGGLGKVAELFGILGSAIIKPGVPRDKEDYSKAIADAAISTNASVVSSKTPKTSPIPPLPTFPNINKIGNGSSQNQTSSSDANSVYYYLRRFGFQDLNIPSKSLVIV